MFFKRCLLLFLLLALAASGLAQWDPLTKIKADFYAWDMILQSMAVDYVAFPKGDDIQAVGAFLKSLYWEEPILYDPWGNLYRYSSNGKAYTLTSPGPDGKAGTADDLTARGTVIEPMPPPEEKPAEPAATFYAIPFPRSTGSSLMLSKSGTDDILFAWSGAGPTYDVTGATDPRFLNSYLLQNDIAGSPYTYTGALKNPKSVEFFDVTEPTETNHAQDANGLYPATPPSLSTASGNWFIGGAVSVTGTTFSEVYKDNVVCFPGGYCIHPDDTSTTTQLDFKVPPGAISGSIVNSIGILESNRLGVTVSLEDPALPVLTIRTIGFAKTTGHYYTCDFEAGAQKAYRHSYDPATGKWARYPVTFFIAPPHFYYGSTKMDQFKHIFFVDAYGTTSLSESTLVVTDPPSDTMAACKALGVPGSGRSVKGAGAAPDPNPENIAGRNVVYFAFDDALNGKYIYKVEVNSGGCGNILDTDYGNRGGAWYWNAIVGMSVDPKTGDLYVAERLTTTTAVVKVIRNDGSETLQTVATGFTNVFGVDVWREPGSDFGFILATDFVASQLKSIPMDNIAAGVSVVTGGSSMRAVTTGLTTYDTSTYQASDLIRLLVAHNDGSTIKLRKPPYFSTDPYESMPVVAWVSSSEPTDKPTYQGVLRPSYQGGAIYSTVKMKASFTDGVARSICVAAGDAQSTAPYESLSSPNPDCCNKPRFDPLSSDPGNPTPGCTAYCDNSGDFSIGGVGAPTAPTADNPYLACRSDCGTPSNPCTFEFKISGGPSGDNYRYYFMGYQSRIVLWSFQAAAWKRGVIQQDQMCKYGGLLFEDFDCQNCSPNCDKITVYSWTNIALGNPIVIFDESNSFATGGELRTIIGKTVNGDGSTTLTLDSALTKSHLATFRDTATPPNPTFSNGHSAGFCVPNAGFYKADSSQLNRRDKTGPFDDAFVQFVAPTATAGVVPYLPMLNFSTGQNYTISFRFHQTWFYPKRPISCIIGPSWDPVSCDNCCNSPQNQFHFIGANQMETGDWGTSSSASDFSFGFEQSIRANCTPCSEAEISLAISHTYCHEQGHQHDLNCLNPTPPPTDFHDDNAVWCGACGAALTQTCVMSVTQGRDDRVDGINRFCCYNLMGTPTLCSANPTKCGSAFRTAPDPK